MNLTLGFFAAPKASKLKRQAEFILALDSGCVDKAKGIESSVNYQLMSNVD